MRLEGKGLNAGAETLSFRFNGKAYQGRRGDTLAAALLANDVRLMGRSFKYHRPRGVLTDGSEETSALVTVGQGAGQVPNVRATMQEVYSGLEAKSQNAWPAVGFDVMAVNDFLSPFLSAGFYYKTFMWPRSFWEGLYEPIIRRAAGLGALSGKSNDEAYERAFAHCDLLVIGAGPSGLMAARAAAEAGCDVILADEQAQMGGRLLSEREEVGGMPGAEWASAQVAALAAMPNVRLMPRTTITGAYDQGSFGALERVSLHEAPDPSVPRECFWRIRAARAILCAGAIERPIAFPDNDRPGVMTASAVRGYLNRYGVVGGQKVAVFGNNDNAHRTARDLEAAGAEVVALIDARPDGQTAISEALAAPCYFGADVSGTRGRTGLTKICLRQGSDITPVEADILGVSGGWNPNLGLTCHMNGRPQWDEALASFVPQPGAVPGLSVAGAARGKMSTAACLADGLAVAAEVIAELGRASPALEAPQAEDDPYRITPLWVVEGKGRKWLDHQNDVTEKDVKLAARENFRSVEHMKRYTTQGMATDQGKTSNFGALAILADATGRTIPETGTTTFRPPFTPVSIAAMGAGAQGKGFAPQRFTTSHVASVDMGAPMIEAGLWYRPSYFPKPGEATWRESCDREVNMVRNAVGVCDVSTLGKIDVQGPDAAAFLDFVYTNMMSTLPVGKVRYGLMLREDGHVMDDGTCARLSDTHFVITTTTAAAGLVMRHLDWVAQALRPELDVQMVSTTEAWAQFAVAGPKSRDLLNSLLSAPVDDASLPYMGYAPVQLGGVAARLFRISFSGEHAYEVAVPARFGESLYRQLLAQAASLGGGAYGMEALNVLRIEKGFITHAEIHGRTTAFDIGMQRMLSQKKDFVGKALSARPGLMDDAREQLVGLRPADGESPLLAGAHLFAPEAEAVRENDQGYITSVCYSPTLGTPLGLGFLSGGRARMGETVRMVDHLRDQEVLCVVGDPVAFDPEGERLRG